MGRILRVVLMVLLVAAAGLGNVWGEEVWVTSENWQYAKIDETTCRIKPKDKNAIGTKVNIPDEVNGLKVVEIGGSAFARCSGLTSVTIPDGVTEIGGSVFAWCSGLTAVAIPNGVTEIGWGAFYGCSGLTGVSIPDGVTDIGDGAFAWCNVMEVTIPSSVKRMGWGAFSGCRGLNAVYWLVGDGCSVGFGVFDERASPATLYVRQGEKAIIERNGEMRWAKEYFSAIVEGYVAIFTDSDGNKLGEQLVKPNGTVTEPAAPIQEGFTFEEWQLGGKKYDFSKPVMKNIKLLAVWKKK